MQNAGLDEMTLDRFGFFPPQVANTAWGSRLERRLEVVRPWRRYLPTQVISARRRLTTLTTDGTTG